MKLLIIILLVLLAADGFAQTDGYYLIYGNRDGSPIRARLGSYLVIPAWGATPPEQLDGINYMHMPLASDNMIVAARQGGFFPDTLVGLWDEVNFLEPNDDSPLPGFISQSMAGFAYLFEPPDYQNFFLTHGDTVIICYFSVRVTDDPSYADSTVCPFQEGIHPQHGGLVWAAGIPQFVPVTTYPCLQLVGCENVPGDINNDSLFNAIDVVYSVNYLKGYGPGPMCFLDCGEGGTVAATADANGNCDYNGVDITYSVNYLKGLGANPVFCEACPPIE